MTPEQLLTLIEFYEQIDQPIPLDLIAEATSLGIIIPEGT